MSSPSRSPRRRLAGIAAAIALGAASVVLVAAPASAHEELVSTDPVADAIVDASPAQIVLTFSGPVLADLGGNQVLITDAAGATLSDGDPVVAGNVVTQPVTDTASGVIAVAWRVVSEDGHPISGEFSFTVSSVASPTATPVPTASNGSAPSPTQVATPSPSATPVAAASQPSPVPWIVLGAVLIAAIAGVVYLLVSRGRRPPPPPAEEPTER